jgi:hypothetical protein
MPTIYSHLQGYVNASDAQAMIDNGATHLGVYVNIETDDVTGDCTYEIILQGLDESGKIVGEKQTPCPSPCASKTGTHT